LRPHVGFRPFLSVFVPLARLPRTRPFHSLSHDRDEHGPHTAREHGTFGRRVRMHLRAFIAALSLCYAARVAAFAEPTLCLKLGRTLGAQCRLHGGRTSAGPAMLAAPAPAEWAGAMAKQALSGLQLEYPHKVDHLWLAQDGPLASPALLHPVFYGNYDWHSAVHSHWCLVRLLRRHADSIDAPAVAAALQASVTQEGCQAEAEYFKREGAATFERPYGWGWLLKLAAECEGAKHDGPSAHKALFKQLSANLV